MLLTRWQALPWEYSPALPSVLWAGDRGAAAEPKLRMEPFVQTCLCMLTHSLRSLLNSVIPHASLHSPSSLSPLSPLSLTTLCIPHPSPPSLPHHSQGFHLYAFCHPCLWTSFAAVQRLPGNTPQHHRASLCKHAVLPSPSESRRVLPRSTPQHCVWRLLRTHCQELEEALVRLCPPWPLVPLLLAVMVPLWPILLRLHMFPLSARQTCHAMGH